MDKQTLTLKLSPEIKAMIKADAKSLNMNPSGYVTMICKSVNAEASSDGMQEFIHQLMKTVSTSVTEGMKE